MKRKVWFIILAASVALAAAAVLFLNKRSPVVEIPALSSGGSAVTEEFLNAQTSVEYYRDKIQKSPETVKNYIELAQIFLQEARVTGRHHEYIPKADYLVTQALERNPQSYDAITTKAAIAMTMHHFAEAKELASRAVNLQPHSASAYGMLCDAELELGEYAAAVAACDKMLAARPDLRSYARASYLREIHGDIPGAIHAMEMAAEAGVAGQENRAWALYNLGKLFLNEGRIDTAGFIFNGILQERPEYAFALSGLAQVKRAQGKDQEAVDLLSKAAQITPEHLFVEQVADLYSSTGREAEARGVSKIVLDMFGQHEKGGWNINREYAMFCATHGMNLDEALSRIKNEYQSRPHNIDVLETYAWVLYNLHRPLEAVPYIEQAVRLQTKSCTLAYHAGMIYQAAGQKDLAEKYLALAKNENRFVNVFAIDDTTTRPHRAAAIQ
ncbi:MAG TPA: tetratricopeptide repeat protein [Bacteroidota bacterium]|nr:tetratricopeptide repeat protein [Bacteroidota bacterium]